jgi:hypothetical protein
MEVSLALVALFAISLLSNSCAPQVESIDSRRRYWADVGRWEPADLDLAGATRMAIAVVTGKNGDALAALLMQKIHDSGRFQLVEASELERAMDGRPSALSAAIARRDAGDLVSLLPQTALVALHVLKYQATGRQFAAHLKTCKRTELRPTYANFTPGITSTLMTPREVEYPCWSDPFTRYEVDLAAEVEILDLTSNTLLGQRRLTCSKRSEKQRTDTGVASESELKDMVDRCFVNMAQQFHKMVATHYAQYNVNVEYDRHLPELDTGNDYLKRGEPQYANPFFAKAVARADSVRALSSATKGRAHYSFALGKALAREYSTARAELRIATTLWPVPEWRELNAFINQLESNDKRTPSHKSDGRNSPGR